MSSSLTIAYYSPFWPPGFGKPNGIVTYVASVKRALEMRGHRVLVLSKSVSPDADQESSIALPRAQTSLAGNLQGKLLGLAGKRPSGVDVLAKTLADAVAQHPDIDLVEIEESFGLYGKVASKLTKPSVIRLHGPWYEAVKGEGKDPNAPDNRQRVALEEAAFRLAPAATAPTQAVLDGMLEETGFTPPLAKAIFNPVSVPADPVTIDADVSKRILFVGRMDYRKGADLALQAFDQVAQANPAATLTVIGPEGGFLLDGQPLKFKEMLDRFVSETSRSRVTYLGPQARETVDQERRRHGITLVASRYETFAYVAVEAMAFGSAVVATEYMGSRELIAHGQTGLIADDTSADSLARAMNSLVGDPSRQHALGSAARAFVAENLSFEAVGRETEDFYRVVLEQHGRSR